MGKLDPNKFKFVFLNAAKPAGESSSPAIVPKRVVKQGPDEIVHLEYDPTTLDPPRSEEWTRFVCISDTHTRRFEVPPGDVLLHSGDLTNTGTVQDFEKTMEWLRSLPHKHKIIIAGNHDLTLHTQWYDEEENYVGFHRGKKQSLEKILELLKGRKARDSGIVYLQDEKFEFQAKEGGRTWSVWGSPWSPEFCNWAFGYRRESEQAENLFKTIPPVDILLTHGPALEIFDRTQSGDDVGCSTLRRHLRRIKPRIHVAGHIHEARGAYVHAWDPASDYALPTVNDSANMDSDDDEPEAVDSVLEDQNIVLPEEETEPVAVSLPSEDGLRRTVFVNAANWPSGRNSRRAGERVPYGGPGFQPVVVDLRG